MLTNEQINEIREHLENARNPVFFFDNDPDGLCSFLLLQRFIGRGRGVAIKTPGSLGAIMVNTPRMPKVARVRRQRRSALRCSGSFLR